MANIEPATPLSENEDEALSVISDDDFFGQNELVFGNKSEEEQSHAFRDITKEEFDMNRARQFGTQNPDLQDVPFWNAMIRSWLSPWPAYQVLSKSFDEEVSFHETKSTWTMARRFGQTRTTLLDGRIVVIAGEYEDFYDPDFCIYNDVFVWNPKDKSYKLYGYPEDVFPPTDFHSATLLGDHIYIIGRLGYVNARQQAHAPIFRLNIHTFRIEKVDTTGDAPGYIFNHSADRVSDHEISIKGGTLVVRNEDGKEEHVANNGEYVLDVANSTWRSVTLPATSAS